MGREPERGRGSARFRPARLCDVGPATATPTAQSPIILELATTCFRAVHVPKLKNKFYLKTHHNIHRLIPFFTNLDTIKLSRVRLCSVGYHCQTKVLPWFHFLQMVPTCLIWDRETTCGIAELRCTNYDRHTTCICTYMSISRIVEVRTQTYDRNVGAGAYCFVCMMSYLIIHVLHDVVLFSLNGRWGAWAPREGGARPQEVDTPPPPSKKRRGRHDDTRRRR